MSLSCILLAISGSQLRVSRLTSHHSYIGYVCGLQDTSKKEINYVGMNERQKEGRTDTRFDPTHQATMMNDSSKERFRSG